MAKTRITRWLSKLIDALREKWLRTGARTTGAQDVRIRWVSEAAVVE